MKPTSIIAVGVLCLGAIAIAGGQMAKIGSAAPAFSAKGTDGKSHTLQTLTAKGDLFLYFIKEDCPINAEAVKYYNRLGNAYKGKANVVGVFDGNESQFKAWNARYKVPFTVLYDPDMKIIKGYKATASPWMIHVSKGKISKVWPGYSAKDLKEMNTAMAGSAKIPAPKVDFAGSPADTRFG